MESQQETQEVSPEFCSKLAMPSRAPTERPACRHGYRHRVHGQILSFFRLHNWHNNKSNHKYKSTTTMTILSSNSTLDDSPLPETDLLQGSERDKDLCLDVPPWIDQWRDDWGEPLSVPEWEDVDSYRAKNGWQGRDLVHDPHAPVRVLEYFVTYGPGVPGLARGGVDTTLTGIAHFTSRAESHQGFCHGGSMCSLMDDIIGWCGFLTTGKCLPWTGFTVQINTSLKKPIRVNSYLLIRAKITNIERRKVSITAELMDPAAEPNNNTHAIGEGLVILNPGVLPEKPQA